MGFKFFILMGALTYVSVFAAAKTPDQKLDEKLAAEKHINTIFDYRMEVQKRINSIIGLTEDTRSKLLVLNSTTYFKIRALDVQYLRLQAVLINDLVNDYDKGEMELIRKRMLSLSERRIATILDGVIASREILGPAAKDNQQLMETFLRINQAAKP